MAEPGKPAGQVERQADLDARYPFIERGADPPGRPVPSPDGTGNRWEGATGWRTRHGESVVRWDLGHPREVFVARLPDGMRGDVGYVLDHGFRRRSSGRTRWVYGTIDIRPDDVVFTDSATQPVYTPPAGDDADLERALAGDTAFLAALQDDRFAQAVYVVFHDREFVRAADLATWSCGDRQAAHLVANLRGAGESYQDYFLRDDLPRSWPDDRPQREAQFRQHIEGLERVLAAPPTVDLPLGARFDGEVIETEEQAARARQRLRDSHEQARRLLEPRLTALRAQLADLRNEPASDVTTALRAHLTRLGWRTVTEEDRRRLGAEAMSKGLELLGAIKQHEALQPGPPGSWWREPPRVSKFGVQAIATRALNGLTPDERTVRMGLRPRVDALAASGRLNEQEYEAMRRRIHAVEGRIGGYAKP